MNDNYNHPKPPKLIQFFSTIFLILVGAALLFCAIFTPPLGEIHPTVLAAFGMILTFIGTVLGIDYKYKSEYYMFLSNLPHYRRHRKEHAQEQEHRKPED